ncbi:MAG: hypothetical protein ABSE93_29180 [Terriglobia bacterium]|jgi:hypothetical protein
MTYCHLGKNYDAGLHRIRTWTCWRLSKAQSCALRQPPAYLEQPSAPADPAAVLEQAAAFYQRQLPRYPEARRYLQQRAVRDADREFGIRWTVSVIVESVHHQIRGEYSASCLSRITLSFQ